MKRVRSREAVWVMAILVAVCWGVSGEDERAAQAQSAIIGDCNPALLTGNDQKKCENERSHEGRRLFDAEHFAGNGRTCVTCHSKKTGTISPEDVQARLAQDPNDPLFVGDGLDDGVQGTSRITTHATIRMELQLPPWVKLANDPTATSIVVNRCVPTTVDTPSFVKAGLPGLNKLLVDGRAPNLQQQALGAIRDHAENTLEPTALELDLIAEFQQNDERFFSSEAVQTFAKGGAAPTLPEGTTDSEKRGRLMFVDAPFTPGSTVGICALCHSGPMLNQANQFSLPIFGTPPGVRFFDIGVSKRNIPGNPVMDFIVTNDDGTTVAFSSPDPGMVLTNPRIANPATPKSFGIDFFRTPILRGITKTAPYFHDNSAKTLEDVAAHYTSSFRTAPG
jgi:cytochrome c peroxidase